MAEREEELRSTLGLDGSHDLVDYVEPGTPAAWSPTSDDAPSTGMSSAEISRRFLGHFADRGHTVVPSASLIADDPTLLLVQRRDGAVQAVLPR
jgi:hypothetical protein